MKVSYNIYLKSGAIINKDVIVKKEEINDVQKATQQAFCEDRRGCFISGNTMIRYSDISAIIFNTIEE